MRKIIDRKKSREYAGMALALALVVIGVIMVASAISRFDHSIEEEQDRQLAGVLESVDYNINDTVTRIEKQMDALTASERFSQAVEAWQMGGDAGDVLAQMENAAVSNMSVFEAMFITRKGEKILSTMEWMDYSIGENITGDIWRCRDGGGTEFLAVRCKLGKDLVCYGVIDLAGMYFRTLERLGLPEDSLMLLEAGTGVLLYQEKGEIRFTTAEEAAKADMPAVREAVMLNESEQTSAAESDSYEKKSGKDKITTRVDTLPSSNTENGIFAISASLDYDALEGLARGTATRLMFYLAIAAAGILLIILLFLKNRREKQQVDLELQNLKEKNRQMEELTRKTQELAHHQRLETIGTMTSSIAHEFNNLLTPIMGYSLMTLEKLPQDDDQIYDDVLEIYNASVKAKDIISRLSELSRKNTESVFKRIVPDDLVNKVLHVTAPALPKNVDIFRELHCGGRSIEGNETQLSQLLLNLVMNAFQAMGEEGGEIILSTAVEGENVVFTVRDSGPGISEEIRDKIFDPFFTTKESGAGTGLGLAIARQAVEDHKGRIEVDSAPGEGTEFRVYIPKADTGLPEGYENYVLETSGADIVDSEDIKTRI
ncbi:MAG: sensor histidine kinase [Lentihominibacter sp.]